MKFIFGLLIGLVLGAVGAVAYSIQTGRDLREAFDEVRSDLGRGDLDALGARLGSRVAEMQAQLESRISEVRDRPNIAVDDATPVIHTAIAKAGEKAEA